MPTSIQAIAGLFLVMAVSFTASIGCEDCLDQNIDSIRYGCFEDCNLAFNPNTKEFSACREGCTTFVFEQRCCSGPCQKEPDVCLAPLIDESDFDHDELQVTQKLSDLSDRAAMPQLKTSQIDESARSIIDSPHQSLKTVGLQRRVDRAKICCVAVQKTLEAAAPRVEPILRGEYPGDEQIAGLALMAFGVAGSFACNLIYDVKCIFNATGAM